VSQKTRLALQPKAETHRHASRFYNKNKTGLCVSPITYWKKKRACCLHDANSTIHPNGAVTTSCRPCAGDWRVTASCHPYAGHHLAPPLCKSLKKDNEGGRPHCTYSRGKIMVGTFLYKQARLILLHWRRLTTSSSQMFISYLYFLHSGSGRGQLKQQPTRSVGTGRWMSGNGGGRRSNRHHCL
jgi:hypothetical protein